MNTNKFSLLLLITINISITNAQYCWNDINTLTTKWNEPNTTNTENWDWTLPGLVHPVYLQNNLTTPSILIELPYFCTKAGGSASCNNDNTYAYEVMALTDKQDIYPENGWELVIKDFGTPNGTIPGRATKNPLFIIYNRYTGKMKVYIAVIGNKTANSAYIALRFPTTGAKRGLLAHAYEIAQTAVAFDTKANFKSLNSYAVQNFDTDYQWLVGEFQMAYDPCTCQKQQGLSSLEIRTVLIDTSNIQATIDGVFTQTLANVTSGVQKETDAKTAFTEMGRSAIKGYNDFTSYQKQFNGILDNSNKEYKDKLVKEWFDDYVKNNPQYQGVSNLTDKYALWDALGKTDDEFKKSLGMNSIDAYQTSKDFRFMKSIVSYVPYVGSAIGLINFLINGGKEKEETKPSPPMVFNVNLVLNGTINKPIPIPAVTFLTPGSYTLNNSSNLTPIYNNTLGVFNILKSPAVKVAGIKHSRNDGKLLYGDYESGLLQEAHPVNFVRYTNEDVKNQGYELFYKTDIFRQYKLAENLKYIVNPSAGVTVEMIDACFILQYSGNTSLQISQRNFKDGISNNTSFPFYQGLLSSALTMKERIKQIEQTGLDLEYLSSDFKTVRFRTKYVPLSCLINQSFTLFAGQAPTVFVKLFIKYKRTDNPNSELITQIVTYDISSSFVNPTYQETDCKIGMEIGIMLTNTYISQGATALPVDGCYGEFVTIQLSRTSTVPEIPCLPFSTIQKPEDRTYSTGMTNSSINGTFYIPDNTTISSNLRVKAKQIVVGKNVTLSNGVQLVSEKGVVLPPDCIIEPNAEISVSPYTSIDSWRCSDIDIATLQATDEEIEKKLCSKDSYLANVLSKKEDENLTHKLAKQTFDFSLYPNPTLNNITLTLQSDETTNLSISILNIVGKVVADRIVLKDAPNQSLIQIDLSYLDNGIYFCSIINQQNERILKRFIVAK